MSTAARNQKLAFTCGAIALGMLGMAYAAVPLYQLFCQVTGYAGTTQRAEAPSGKVLKRTITVRFDANTDKRLPWTFEPVKASMTVRIGEQNLAFYRATNTSDKPVTGTASFNVAPAIAGSHFAKIACFCFTEQTLKPGQSVDMPVSFYVDPGLVEDADARGVQEITLS
ncbi:MAG: cytochrome c oxidase assembly protein, partial [Pseudomonadota bacterium]